MHQFEVGIARRRRAAWWEDEVLDVEHVEQPWTFIRRCQENAQADITLARATTRRQAPLLTARSIPQKHQGSIAVAPDNSGNGR